MKTTQICPKCRNSEILKVEGFQGAYGVGNNIPSGFFSSTLVDRFICCKCGYSEEWIRLEDIPKLKKKYDNNETNLR